MSWVICDNCKFIFLIVGKGPRIVIILGARQSKLFSLATVGHMGLFPCYIIFHSLHDTLETCKGHFCRQDAISWKKNVELYIVTKGVQFSLTVFSILQNDAIISNEIENFFCRFLLVSSHYTVEINTLIFHIQTLIIDIYQFDVYL